VCRAQLPTVAASVRVSRAGAQRERGDRDRSYNITYIVYVYNSIIVLYIPTRAKEKKIIKLEYIY